MGGQSPGNCLVTCAAHSFALFFIDVDSPTGMFLAKLSITYILMPLAPTDCFDATRRVLPPCVENIFQTVPSPPSLENRDRTETKGVSSFQPVTIPFPRPKRETDLPSNPPSPPSLFALKKQDGGGHLPSNPSPSPSLARNARRRGPSSFQPVTISLPRSKCETEGAGFLPTHHHPLPSLGTRDRGPVSFQPTSLARNVRRRGCFSFQHYPSPSLARNARRRGPASFQPTSLARNVRRRGPSLSNTTHLPPSLETRNGGGRFFPTTPIPLPRSKRETEGVVSFQPPRFPPSLETGDRGGSSNHPRSSPSLFERDGGGHLFPTTPRSPPSLETRDGGAVSFHGSMTITSVAMELCREKRWLTLRFHDELVATESRRDASINQHKPTLDTNPHVRLSIRMLRVFLGGKPLLPVCTLYFRYRVLLKK